MTRELIYISLPIGDKEAEARINANIKKKYLQNQRRDLIFYTPFDLPNLDLTGIEKCANRGDLAWFAHLRHDLKYLLIADSIYLMDGWTESNGCLLEMQFAFLFGKKIIQNVNLNSVSKENRQTLFENVKRFINLDFSGIDRNEFITYLNGIS